MRGLASYILYMAYFYLDDSKHHPHGFSLAAFAICDEDPHEELEALFAKYGFDTATNFVANVAKLFHIPMCRYLSDPVYAAVFHGGVGVQALGDRTIDQDGLLLVQQINQPPLLLNRRINLGDFFVKKLYDPVLNCKRRNHGQECFELFPIQPFPKVSDPLREAVHLPDEQVGSIQILKEGGVDFSDGFRDNISGTVRAAHHAQA